MPLDSTKVAFAMSQGLSRVCAHCQRFWRAQDEGALSAKCTAIGRCGSPIAGDDFNLYEGEITDFKSVCFVCEEKSRYGLLVSGSLRVIGVCSRHVLLLNQLAPDKTEGTKAVEIRGAPDGLLPLPSVGKSLAAAIKEAEDYFRKKNGEDDGS